jgi:hypothetical protein
MANKQATLAKKLIRIAHANPDKKAELVPKIHKLLGKQAKATKLAAWQQADLEEALHLAGKYPEKTVTTLPGFSPMQLRQLIQKMGESRQQLELLKAQHKDVLKQMKDLEKSEKEGKKLIEAAGKQLDMKYKYTVDLEATLITFTAFIQGKPPGIEQMAANPADKKWGEKAGDLYGRVAAELGQEVADAVQVIYESVKEDLTHYAPVVKYTKIIDKTSSLNDATLKTAGILDTVISFKEWLAGKASALFRAVGDIGRWLKGFVERTKLVKRVSGDTIKALNAFRKEAETLARGAR